MKEPALTFAIGDIHGCQRALLHLLDLGRDYAKAQACRLVFIGDYIDRGPDSSGGNQQNCHQGDMNLSIRAYLV